MRMRTKKNREARLKKVDNYFCILDNERIDFNSSFQSTAPLWVELGCGKGAFAVAMSKRRTDVNYLAFEKVTDALLMAMEKADREQCPNLKFFNGDASNVCELLNGTKADALFINFCDPWPKKRNAKRRLTSPQFLEKYKMILANGAHIYFKTDNRPLFDYSLETFTQAGFVLTKVTCDLHASPMNSENIETEYEKTFSLKGYAINYLEAVLPQN